MTDLCFITTCMGRLSYLKETLPTYVMQPGASCIVVDYSCPERCGEWVEQNYPQVKVVRVENQTRFQQAHARIAGGQHADSPWLCFIDADIALSSSFLDSVRPFLKTGNYYQAHPINKELSGTAICSRTDYTKVGGYDEVFQDWGYEDIDLYTRLKISGVVEASFPISLVRLLTHDDSLRVQYYNVKRKEMSWLRNQLYSSIKIDYWKMINRLLSVGERRQLYEQAAKWVEQAFINGQREAVFNLSIRNWTIPVGISVGSLLSYTLKLPPLEPPKDTK